MAMSLTIRTVLAAGAMAAMSGCTYYKTYETPAASAPAPVVVQDRAPDTVVVPQQPSTVVVPAKPNTVIVPDNGPPRTIIVNPPPSN